MIKKITFIIAALFFACSQDTGVDWLSGSFTLALDAAREQNKPILVDFYSDT